MLGTANINDINFVHLKSIYAAKIRENTEYIDFLHTTGNRKAAFNIRIQL